MNTAVQKAGTAKPTPSTEPELQWGKMTPEGSWFASPSRAVIEEHLAQFDGEIVPVLVFEHTDAGQDIQPVPPPALRPKLRRPPGAIEGGGTWLWPDTRGQFTKEEMIRAEDRIEDEMVRKILDFAIDLNAQISRFREHTFADIGDFMALLQQEYGVSKGGPKGNVTFVSYDGLLRVQVQVADLIEFGPQLQVAKQLIDECLNEWSAGSRPEIQTIVTRAFNTDKEGQVNRAELYRLRRLDIADERWQQAMKAITDASRTAGSKEYVRFHRRNTPEGGWEAVTIDLASA